MSKRRQGPINKRLILFNKLNKYSIRKFTVGNFNISWCYFDFGHDDEAKQENHMENTL